MENFRKFATEETDSVMNEGFFGNMGDKMGFETGTTKGRVARIGMLVKLWQEAVENADIMDAEDFDGLMANTGEHLKAANFEPEKIAQILLAMGSGDGSAASDAYLAAAQDVQMRGGAGSDLIELFRNGLEDIVYAVGEEEARRSAQTHAENMAGLKSDVEAQAAADSTDNSKRIQRVSDDDDDVPHGRATSAVASSNLAYGEGKINQAQLIKIIKEELKRIRAEGCGGDPDEELDADQIASLEEPVDATAGMSDDDVDRLAAMLAAQAETWDDGEGW